VRIIGGEYRSRRIKPVPGYDVRPTPDRLRESLFSVLMPVIEDSIFIDAYAGTGAVGLEAISRGAAQAILIEKDPRALAILRENVNSLGAGAKALIIKGKAATIIGAHPADILFIDPPYPQENEYALCLEQAVHHRLVIAQHASKFQIREQYGELKRYRQLRQGDNTLSFFRRPNLDQNDSGEHSDGSESGPQGENLA
jgi:16S rRNA (guanine966-N2)-methyltransferase